MLTDWTRDTLDDGCFTFGSGVYQIGVMLGELSVYACGANSSTACLMLVASAHYQRPQVTACQAASMFAATLLVLFDGHSKNSI